MGADLAENAAMAQLIFYIVGLLQGHVLSDITDVQTVLHLCYTVPVRLVVKRDKAAMIGEKGREDGM
jgi:hypothetical protein